MQYLDYETPVITRVDWVTPTLLFAPPLIAAPIAIFVRVWWINEPFMILRFIDVAVFFGGPLLLLLLCWMWTRIARQQKLSWFLIIPVICWFATATYFALEQLSQYFHEGWYVGWE